MKKIFTSFLLAAVMLLNGQAVQVSAQSLDGVAIANVYDNAGGMLQAASEESVPAAGTIDFYVPGDGAVASTADVVYELPVPQDIEGVFTKGPVSVEFRDAPTASYHNHTYLSDASNPLPHIRLYGGNYFKVIVADAEISRIEWVIAKGSKGVPTASVGTIAGDGTTTGSSLVWTGSVANGAVEFTLSKQLRFTHMVVTYKKSGSDETALEMLETTGVHYANGVVYNPNNLRMQVFSIQGQKVADTYNDFDMNSLCHGIYVVKAGNAVLKFIK